MQVGGQYLLYEILRGGLQTLAKGLLIFVIIQQSVPI